MKKTNLFSKLIELLYLNQKGNLAYYDVLTGYYNYNWLQLEGVKKYQNQDVYITMIDVNQFKEINDHYGHEFGNKILATIATYIKTSLNDDKIDYIRYGGDEFILISKTRVAMALDRLNNCSISYGYYYKTKNCSMHEAIERADKNMYRHKLIFKTVNGDINRANILNLYRKMYRESLKTECK